MHLTQPTKEETPMMKTTSIAARAAGACALALALMSQAQAAPLLEMSAASTSAGFDITVNARDFSDLYAWQLTLDFDPSLVTALGVSEGSFLPDTGGTFFSPGITDNTAGSISFVFGALTGPGAGVTGSGELVTFSFGVDQVGLANFSLSDVQFVDSTGAVLTVDVRNLVTAVPEPATLGMFGLGLFALLGARALKAKAR